MFKKYYFRSGFIAGIVTLLSLSTVQGADFLLDLSSPEIRAAIKQQGGGVVADGPEGVAKQADQKKILFFGNSITRHPPSKQVDWSNNWGMAASAENKDYVHLVVEALSNSGGKKVDFMIENGVPFESGFETYNLNDLDAALTYNADIVVIAIGENANSLTTQEKKDTFEEKLNEIVRALKQAGNPTIVIRSTFWGQTERDEILKQVAGKHDCLYADISHLVVDESNYARSERDYTHEGVGMHPGDKGMQNIADAILAALKTDPSLFQGEDFRLDLNSPDVRASIEKQGAEIVDGGPGGHPAVKIISRAEVGNSSTAAAKLVILPFDVAPYKGAKIEISGQVRGENITKPGHVYTGVKVQLHVMTAGGQQSWIDQGGTHGTFDWKELSARSGIPQDANEAFLTLGMQECTGTVWISDVVIRLVEEAKVRPAPKDVNVTTQLRGVMSPLDVDPQDFKAMKEWNINLVRWQMFGVPEHLADYDGWFARQLVKIEQALDQAEANDIGIIIDFHYLPGGREENGDSRLFYDKKLQEDFIGYWEQIATRFKDHPALYAYDLMNEPVQRSESPEGVDNWYELQVRTAKAIREIDPKTLITIESDDWCNPGGYLTLEPIELPGIIYQVHSYWPGGFTHQGIFTDQGIAKDVDSKESAVTYPGIIGGQFVDKEALRKSLQPVRDFQLAYDVPIYVGEFSAVRWAPGAAQFLDDLISIFEEYGWDWSYHAFREYGGWSVEHENLPYDRDHHVKASEPTDRQEVLMKWFKLNKPYGTSK